LDSSDHTTAFRGSIHATKSARIAQPDFWQEVPMYFHTEGFGPYERYIVPFKILPSGDTW
jgi:hypothetical protein